MAMNEKKKRVVVLSRNYSTGLSVIRSLGSAGYAIDLVASAFKPGKSKMAAVSKYVDSAVEVVSKKVKSGADEALLDELLLYTGRYKEKPVLFPTDDYTASVMDMNRSLLDDIFIMPTMVGGTDGCLTTSMNKAVQAKMAARAGLLMPEEWIISLRENPIEIPDDVVYPCFCKPIESITGYKHEMARCESEEELAAHLKDLQKKFSERDVLVQEFLEIENEIDIGGVCFDQEVIIPAIIKKTRVAQYEKGVTLAGVVAPPEELGDLYDKIVTMLKLFRYIGMFDMELNIANGKIYFNEINFRSGGPNYSYFESGVNLPALYVKEAFGEGHEKKDEQVTEFGKNFIYEKVAWDDYIHGFMTKQELERSIEEADITLLYSEDDPAPSEVFLEEVKSEAIKYKLRQKKRFVESNARRGVQTVKRVARPVKHRLMGYPQTKAENRRDPNAERPRVLVCGRNYCSILCMARSLGMAGYEVEVLRIFQKRPKKRELMKMLKPEAYSKYVKAYYVCVSNRNPERILNRLKELADLDNKMLLVPVDDLIADITDTNYNEMSRYYIMQTVRGEEGALSALMSKDMQKQLSKAAGLPVLGSCVIHAEEGKFTIPDTVKYPCFIKPNISKNSAKSTMRRCDNERELSEALKVLSRRKPVDMLVEDFVEIKTEISILGLCADKDVVGPGVFFATRDGHAEHRGVAMTGELVPPEWLEPLHSQIMQFLSTLGYTGLYDVDLVRTKDGGLYFVEVNLRYGASGFALTKAGINLPGMYADHMVYGTPIDTDCHLDHYGQTFVSEKILIDEYVGGRIPAETIKECMAETDIPFIKNEDDPKPYAHFKKFYQVAAVRRRLQ